MEKKQGQATAFAKAHASFARLGPSKDGSRRCALSASALKRAPGQLKFSRPETQLHRTISISLYKILTESHKAAFA